MTSQEKSNSELINSQDNGVNMVFEGGWTVFNKQFAIVQDILANNKKINSVIGYSSGVLTCLLICLGINEKEYLEILSKIPELGTIITYINEFITNENSIYNIMNILFTPFLDYKKISHYITLKELKELSGIDMYIVTARSKANIEDPLFNYYFSSFTHPDTEVLTALSLSISQTNSILNFGELSYLGYTYQDTPTQTEYIKNITKNLSGDIIYVGIQPDLALFPLPSENPLTYFNSTRLYSREINKTTIIRQIVGVTLDLLFELDPVKDGIKNIVSSNDSLENTVISLQNAQDELTEVFSFLLDPNHRENVYNFNKTNYKTINQ
jgi:hypothetical protein